MLCSDFQEEVVTLGGAWMNSLSYCSNRQTFMHVLSTMWCWIRCCPSSFQWKIAAVHRNLTEQPKCAEHVDGASGCGDQLGQMFLLARGSWLIIIISNPATCNEMGHIQILCWPSRICTFLPLTGLTMPWKTTGTQPSNVKPRWEHMLWMMTGARYHPLLWSRARSALCILHILTSTMFHLTHHLLLCYRARSALPQIQTVTLSLPTLLANLIYFNNKRRMCC